LEGNRTSWAFFPLWLGFILFLDALNLRIGRTSLLSRNWRKFIGLFLVSAPSWWLFEVFNWRLGNWEYLGRGQFTDLHYFVFASLSFSTVIPAVFEAAELVSHAPFIRRIKPGLVIRADRPTTLLFFSLGWFFLGLMLAWPDRFFPLVWLSVYFILEPVNAWLGNNHLANWTGRGDWRPIASLFLGVLITGFFWEMWNYYSFPKWIYHVPGVNSWHLFEMPALGYGGYLPFSLELFALYNLVTGLLKIKNHNYVKFNPE